jgi:phage baseplate assembly protein W
MPFNAQNISPTNLNPTTGLGVSIPFSNSSVFSSTYTTQETVKNNLINYFLTNPGEIPLNPTFGGGLRAFIFEQIAEGTLDGLEQNINSSIQNVFPNVIVNSIDILKNDDTNEVIIKLQYSIANSNVNDNLTLQF